MKTTDYESPKVRIIENFITKEECDWIINSANSTNLWAHDNKTPDQFKNQEEFENYYYSWANRVVNLNTLYTQKKPEHKELLSKTLPIQKLMKEQIVDFFKMDFPIYSESWEVVRWGKPYFNYQQPHIDYIDLDFDLNKIEEYDLPESSKKYLLDNPHLVDLYQRKFAGKNFTSMLYLNEDFEGGELYFPQYNDFEIRPKPGLLVIFSGTLKHLHGIREITSGMRYVHTTFWSKYPQYASLVARDWSRNSIDKEYYGLV